MRALAGRAGRDAHPDWCAQEHHCTAGRLPEGEHASIPEVWRTSNGRVVATRYASARTGAGHLELRFEIPLPADEGTAQAMCRHLIAAGHFVLSRTLGD